MYDTASPASSLDFNDFTSEPMNPVNAFLVTPAFALGLIVRAKETQYDVK